jgi:hypothetical protein
MKAKEHQYDFNIKLMQILERIENKIDKEIESCWTIIRRSHDEKRREETSVDMHQPHSPKHHLRKCAVAQVHLLSESIREGLGWTS